jgi:hypothetical protein
MAARDNSKPYDLEERTAVFAERGRAFVKRLPRTIGNVEDAKQFIRASGSIGANYIEANEAIGKSRSAVEKPRRLAIGCACLMSMVNLNKNASTSHPRQKS